MTTTIHALPTPTDTPIPFTTPDTDAYGRLLGGIVLQILRDYLARHPERSRTLRPTP